MDPAALLDFLGFSTGEVERFALIVARLTGLFVSAPFFSRSVGPQRIRATLILMIALVIYPVVNPWTGEASGNNLQMFSAAVSEAAIGAVMGILVHWTLVSVQVAGGVVGFSMGLSMAMVMDPTSGMQEGVLSNLLYLTALILFITIDGHHILLEGLVRSFQSMPLGAGLPEAGKVLEAAVMIILQVFKVALLVSGPVLVATKMLYFGMGLINRASPQVQVFFVAMPIAQTMGFVVLGLTVMLLGQLLARELDGIYSVAFKVLGM